jgi:hypothetical protein
MTIETSNKIYVDGIEIVIIKKVSEKSFCKVFFGKTESEEVIIKVFSRRKNCMKEK